MASYPIFPLRISPIYIAKLKAIAEQSGRSANKQVEQIIVRYIADWEALHGVIEINAPGNTDQVDK